MRLITCLILALSAAPAATIATFTFVEPYGVNHPQQVVCMDMTAAFNPKASHMNAPNGTEVFYQKTYGQVCIQARLPAGTSPVVFNSSPSVSSSRDTIYWDNLNLAAGELLYFETGGGSPTCGLTDATTYAVYQMNYRLDQSVSLTAAPGGSLIDLTTTNCGNGPKITKTGFTAVGSTDLITAPNHQRLAGDPISFSGTCPTGLTCDGTTVYYVIASGFTPNAFKVSTSVGGAAINIGDLASGLNRLVTKWSWTLVDTGAPTATATNPIAIDLSTSSYIQLTNGLTGVRITRPSLGTPLTIEAGTLTNCTANGSTGTCTATSPLNTSICPSGCPYSTVSISGGGNTNEIVGVQTVLSNPSASSFTFATSRNGTYNNALLAVVPGNASQDPLGAILLSDGTWQQNIGYLGMGVNGEKIAQAPSTVTNVAANNRAFTWKFKEAGPLKTVVEATYTGYLPALRDGNDNLITDSTAGTNGTFTRTFTFLAGSKTIAVKNSGNQNYASFLSLDTTKFDRIGNRTFNPPSSGGCGAYGPVTITGATNANPIVVTAVNHGMLSSATWTVTITGVGGNTAANTTAPATPVDRDHFSIAVAGNGTYTSGGSFTATMNSGQDRLSNLTKAISYAGTVDIGGCDANYRRAIGIWNFHADGGIQQWVYKAGGSPTDPAVALFPGRASVQNNSIQSTTGWYSNATPGLYAYTVLNPCPACGTANPHVFSSDIVLETDYYSGTIADITPVFGSAAGSPQDPSGLSLEQNWVTGISMEDLYAMQLNFPDPVGGWKFPYMPDASVGTIRTNYQTNNPSGYTALMDASVGNGGLATTRTWTADDSASIDTQIITPARGVNFNFVNGLINGDGIYGLCCAAISGAIDIGTKIVNNTNALANPNVTTDQVIALKADLALNCSLPWDQDYLPADFNNLGGGSGANQVATILGGKYRCVSVLPTQPYLAAQGQATLVSNTNALVNAAVNTYGAYSTSFHYSGSSTNTFFTMIGQKKAAQAGFSVANYPSVGRSVGFLRNGMTPPEPRFGVSPMMPPVGDGIIEAQGTVGMLATLYDGIDTGISQAAIAAWFAVNNTSRFAYDDFYGANFIAIDSTITNPGFAARTTTNYPGYYTSLRHGAGTVNEHWCLLIAGNFYTDHNHQDQGDLSQCYAFKAPLMGDFEVNQNGWASASLHSVAVYDSSLSGYTWYQSPNSLSLPSQLGAGTQTEIFAGTKSSYTCSVVGTVWTRCVTMINTTPAKPIIHVRDTFTGGSAAKAVTYMFHYNGEAVTIPGGTVTPTYAKIANCVDSPPSAFPSGFTPTSLPSGVQKFSFTGQYWPVISDGVNTDVYVVRATNGAEFGIGDWRHNCIGGGQQTRYNASNTVSLSSFTALAGTTASLVFANWVPLKGQTGTIVGVTGSGSPNGAVTVTAVTGAHTATVSGLGGLTGSYSGGSVIWDFMEDFAFLRLHDTTDFDVSLFPYLKSGSASAAPTVQSCGYQIVNGGETTCYSDTQMTYTNGTVQVLTSFDTSPHTAFSMTVSGGPQEVVKDQTTITWKVDGITAGIRTFSPPAGNWYPDKPLITAGAAVSLYHQGGAQPSPYTVTFTQTPVTLRTVPLSFRPDPAVGATQVRLRYNGSTEFVSLSACGVTCTASILLPQGSTTIDWDYLDANGDVLSSTSLAMATTIN